jgi:radical SAM superfamily enzyme YgiQ (UPF0313 family)
VIHPDTVKNLRRFNNQLPIFFVFDQTRRFLPLALGMIRACLQHDVGKALPGEYLLMPLFGAEELDQVARSFSPGVWLFSIYVWSEEVNLEFSRQLKKIHPDNLIIHGGPSVPRRAEACQAFLRRHPEVDLVVQGEGELTVVELFSCLGSSTDLIHDLGKMPGIAFLASHDRNETQFIQTPKRAAIENLDNLPSPYLTGVFDNLTHNFYATLETTRGCPHHCAFCDWSGLGSKRIRCFDLDRVKSEIDWFGRHQISIIQIADAHFGLSERDIEVAACLARTKVKYGFPKEIYISYNRSTLKYIPAIVQTIIKAGISTQGVIPLQTIDQTTLENVGRQELKSWYVEGLRDIFLDQDLPLSTELILGLPGATMASFKQDLQYCFDRDLLAETYTLWVLPNSRLAEPEYRERFRIETDDNNKIESTYSYSREDCRRMKILRGLYKWFEGRGLLRHLLRYLQWDYAIPAPDFMDQFITHFQESPESYPSVRLDQMPNLILAPEIQSGNWSVFYQDLAAYILAQYAVTDNSAFRTVLTVNEAVMPRPGRKFPEIISLAHDYVSYFLYNSRCAPEDRRRLTHYAPGKLTITDPHGLCSLDISHCRQWHGGQFFWELDSPIARRSSTPHFVDAPMALPPQTTDPRDDCKNYLLAKVRGRP